MISLLFKGFFKNLLGGNITTVFVTIMIVIMGLMIIPNYDKVAGWFGYKTRTVLIEDLKQANLNTDKAVDANKATNETVAVLAETVKNVEEVIVNKVEKEKVTTDKVNKIKNNRQEKVNVVERSEATEEIKVEQLSSINIDTVWETYCSLNPDNQCVNQQGASS